MKKKLLFSGLLLASTLLVNAQEKIKWGVQAGVNFANLSTSTSGVSVSLSSKVGLHAGVSAEVGISPDFAFQPELAYNGYGAKLDISDFNIEGLSGELKSNINYISLPLLFKYKVANTGLGIYAGPQLGLLVSAKDSYDGESIDAKDDYNSFDLLASFGAEYFLPAGVGLIARYQLGLTNIMKDTAGDESVKNKAFTIGIGYRF